MNKSMLPSFHSDKSQHQNGYKPLVNEHTQNDLLFDNNNLIARNGKTKNVSNLLLNGSSHQFLTAQNPNNRLIFV